MGEFMFGKIQRLCVLSGLYVAGTGFAGSAPLPDANGFIVLTNSLAPSSIVKSSHDPFDLALTVNGASAIGSIAFEPSPILKGNVSLDFPSMLTVQEQLQYFFRFDGPTETLSTIIHTRGEVPSPTSNIPANVVSLFFQDPSDTIMIASACQGKGANSAVNCATYTVQPSFSVDYSTVLQRNTEYNFSMNLFLGANTASFGGLDKSAYIDPWITIDPDVTNPDQYHFEFSRGVGNSPIPVPEIGTWLMMGLGFAGISVLVAQRRQSV
jgi:hypothetical protein